MNTVTNLQEIAKQIGTLLEQKNLEYGSAFEKVSDFLKILFPQGIPPEQYLHAMLVVRIFDKLMRISQGALKDSYRDIAGYGVLGEYVRQSLEMHLENLRIGL